MSSMEDASNLAVPSPQACGMSAMAVERRIRLLRRALQKQLGKKPTELQRTAIERAAVMSARAEALAADPHAPALDVVRMDNAASRARAAAVAAIGKRPVDDDVLDELLP